jgi:ketosteroid isomerase-like protein
MTTTTQDALVRANLSFYDAINAGDIEAMDALWANAALVTCAHPGWPALHGRDEVISSWRAILLGLAPPKILCVEPHASVLGEEVGYVLCREQLDDQTLVATNLFVREQGLWLVAHHQAGPMADWNVPEPQSMLVN